MELEAWLARNPACDVFLVIADEEKRPEALGVLSELRTAGIATDYVMNKLNVGKQFKKAQQSGARFALVVGNRIPRTST